jgi:hypothetical protein
MSCCIDFKCLRKLGGVWGWAGNLIISPGSNNGIRVVPRHRNHVAMG